MKIKLDENVPVSTKHDLAALGHEVDSVLDESLQGHIDADVWRAAQADDRFLITQDLDFSDVRKFKPGTHHGVLLVRLLRPSRASVHARIVQTFRTEDVEQWRGCFVVLSDAKIRVKRP